MERLGSLTFVLFLIAGCADGVDNPPGAFGVNGLAGNPGLGTSGTGAAAGTGSVNNGTAGAAGTMMTRSMNTDSGRGSAGMMGGAGMTAGSAGRMMTGGMGGAMPPAGGSVAPTPPGSMNPTIPEVTGECPAFMDGSITFGGVSGIRIAAGPKASAPSAPMVIYWHGTGSTAGEYAGHAPIVRGATGEGGVIVSFGGSSGVGDASCSGTFIFSLGDMDIVDQLVACAVKNHNVDPRRIYVTGCSAGGLFAACQAARRSSYIAAAAPNSGGFVFPQMFQNMYTPALMTIHGGSSDVVGVNFTDTSRTADMTFKNRGGFVINCNHGGFHCGGGVVDAQVWEFFKAHPYGVDPKPWTALPAGWPDYCMIF